MFRARNSATQALRYVSRHSCISQSSRILSARASAGATWLNTPHLTDIPATQSRCFWNSSRYPFDKDTLLDKAKRGALTIAGIGCGVAVLGFATSAFVVIAIGGGIAAGSYFLYNVVREKVLSTQVNNKVVNDALHKVFGRSTSVIGRNPALKGMPIMAQALIQSVMMFAGSEMRNSIQRIEEIHRIADQTFEQSARVRSMLGSNAYVADPVSMNESTINGVGKIDAAFMVDNSRVPGAELRVKAEIRNDKLELTKFDLWNPVTREKLNLLSESKSDSSVIIDADFTEVRK